MQSVVSSDLAPTTPEWLAAVLDEDEVYERRPIAAREAAERRSCEHQAELRRIYRTLRCVGWSRYTARRGAHRFVALAALRRAEAMLASEPGGWTADGEYVAVGR